MDISHLPAFPWFYTKVKKKILMRWNLLPVVVKNFEERCFKYLEKD